MHCLDGRDRRAGAGAGGVQAELAAAGDDGIDHPGVFSAAALPRASAASSSFICTICPAWASTLATLAQSSGLVALQWISPAPVSRTMPMARMMGGWGWTAGETPFVGLRLLILNSQRIGYCR